MTWHFDSDQVSDASYTTVVQSPPAGTTLLSAELDCTVSYALQGTETSYPQFAPPNLLLGIFWAPHGTSIPVITTSNWTDGDFYMFGFGTVEVASSEIVALGTGDWQTIRNIRQRISKQSPDYEADAYDLGISLNWLGAGFYGVTPWLTWQLKAYVT